LSSNRLDRLAKFLNIKARKTIVDFNIWADARIGDKKALKYVYTHGQADVHVLREVLEELTGRFPFILSWASIYDDPDTCPHCDVGPIRKRGWSYATLSRRRQYRCDNCGGWHSGKPERLGINQR